MSKCIYICVRMYIELRLPVNSAGQDNCGPSANSLPWPSCGWEWRARHEPSKLPSTPQLSPRRIREAGGPTTANAPTFLGCTGGPCSTWTGGLPGPPLSMACISRSPCTIKHVLMYTLPFVHALLWFCIFGAADWLETSARSWTTRFATSAPSTQTCASGAAPGTCFDLRLSIPGDAFPAYSLKVLWGRFLRILA